MLTFTAWPRPEAHAAGEDYYLMRQINRMPAFVALCWGAIILVMMPAATQLMRPQGVTVTWTALMCAEGLLLILCAWAQLASSSDAWTRMFVVIAFLLAIYVGLDLNEARDAQQAFDSTGAYNIQYVSNQTEIPETRIHSAQIKNAH